MMEAFQPEGEVVFENNFVQDNHHRPGPSKDRQQKETVILMDEPVPDLVERHYLDAMHNPRVQEPLPFEDADADVVGKLKVKTAAAAKRFNAGFWESVHHYLAGMIADPMALLFGTEPKAAAVGNPAMAQKRANKPQRPHYQFDLYRMCTVAQLNHEEMRSVLSLPKQNASYKLTRMHISAFRLSSSKFQALQKLYISNSNSQEFVGSAVYVNMAMEALGTLGIRQARAVNIEEIDDIADNFEEQMSNIKIVTERVDEAFKNVAYKRVEGEKETEITLDDLREEFDMMDVRDQQQQQEPQPPPQPRKQLPKKEKAVVRAKPAPPIQQQQPQADLESMFMQLDSIKDNVVMLPPPPPPPRPLPVVVPAPRVPIPTGEASSPKNESVLPKYLRREQAPTPKPAPAPKQDPQPLPVNEPVPARAPNVIKFNFKKRTPETAS